MPYSRDGNCVKDKNGKTVKCHDSEAKAQAHLEALRINVEGQEKMQVHVDVKAHSRGAAGATFLLSFGFNEKIDAVKVLIQDLMGDDVDGVVRWVDSYSYHITLVGSALIDDAQVQAVIAKLPAELGVIPLTLGAAAAFAQDDKTVLILEVADNEALATLQRTIYDAVVASGAPVSAYSIPDQWQPHVTLAYMSTDVPVPEFDFPITVAPRRLDVTRADYYIEARILDVLPDYDAPMAMRTATESTRLERLVKSLAKAIVRQDPWLDGESSGLKVFADGKRWLAWWTNNWYDYEREVFPQKAIDDFLGRVKSGAEPYPDLYFSHLNSLTHGKADTLWHVGSIVMAAGTFDDSVLAHRMKVYYREAQKRGVKFRVSHGFRYPPTLKIKGAYYHFTTFEISPIPEVGAFRAANPYTLWEVKTMQLPDEVKREIAMALSDDGKTVNDTTLKRAETVIAAANGENEKAAAEGRQQKNESVTPADNAARIDNLEKSLSEKFDGFQKAFNDKMTAALTAFETGVKTNVAAAESFAAVTKRLDALEAWQTEQKQLAPRGTRNPANEIPAGSPLSQWLTDQENKSDTRPLSAVEMMTGIRSVEIENGGTPNVPAS